MSDETPKDEARLAYEKALQESRATHQEQLAPLFGQRDARRERFCALLLSARRARAEFEVGLLYEKPHAGVRGLERQMVLRLQASTPEAKEIPGLVPFLLRTKAGRQMLREMLAVLDEHEDADIATYMAHLALEEARKRAEEDYRRSQGEAQSSSMTV